MYYVSLSQILSYVTLNFTSRDIKFGSFSNPYQLCKKGENGLNLFEKFQTISSVVYMKEVIKQEGANEIGLVCIG